MDITVRIVSRISLYSETVGFFTNFKKTGVEWTSKTGLLEKSQKLTIFNEYSFKIIRT